MTSSRIIALCLVVCCASFAGTFAVADEEADHAALRVLVDKYQEAIKTKNPSALSPHLADDFSGVMITGEETTDLQSLEAYWQKIQKLLGDGGEYTVAVNVPEPATIVGDLAFAHGSTDDTVVTSSGKTYEFNGYWTAICRREADGWKIVRIHGSMDSITNTFVKGALTKVTRVAGFGGGAIGFVLGASLLWLLKRRRA